VDNRQKRRRFIKKYSNPNCPLQQTIDYSGLFNSSNCSKVVEIRFNSSTRYE
jgi:hypothetical protein